MPSLLTPDYEGRTVQRKDLSTRKAPTRNSPKMKRANSLTIQVNKHVYLRTVYTPIAKIGYLQSPPFAHLPACLRPLIQVTRHHLCAF